MECKLKAEKLSVVKMYTETFCFQTINLCCWRWYFWVSKAV